MGMQPSDQWRLSIKLNGDVKQQVFKRAHVNQQTIKTMIAKALGAPVTDVELGDNSSFILRKAHPGIWFVSIISLAHKS